MDYLQKTLSEATARKSALETEIQKLQARLRELQNEHKTVSQVLRSLEKSIPSTEKKRPKRKSTVKVKVEDARTGIRPGSWSEKVVELLTGNGRMLLKEIVDSAIEEGLDEDLDKDQVRKRIMNALNSLHKMGIVGIEAAHYSTRYYLLPSK